MFRNALIISTLLASTMALSGCSPVWTKLGDLSYSLAEFTKPSLRGSSTETEVDFNETSVSENGVYKTAIGEYIPTEVSYSDDGSAVVDTSQHPCPEGTYLNDENACMFLETETFEFTDTLEVNFDPAVDTGPVPCPEDTYLTEENTCSYFEAETISFDDELQTNVAQPIETGPVPCPEGTYLTAENTCTFLETEEFDFASNDAIQDTEIANFDYAQEAVTIAPVDKTQSFSFNQSVECPPGFKPDANNSCMYLGAELTLK